LCENFFWCSGRVSSWWSLNFISIINFFLSKLILFVSILTNFDLPKFSAVWDVVELIEQTIMNFEIKIKFLKCFADLPKNAKKNYVTVYMVHVGRKSVPRSPVTMLILLCPVQTLIICVIFLFNYGRHYLWPSKFQ